MRRIQREICREELISRVPGMFAYIEFKESGACKMHKACDSIDGCYGKVVEALEIPAKLVVNGRTIIAEHGVYTFREMMDAYYTYRDEVGDENPFVKFVERGTGRVSVKDYAKAKGIELGQSCDLVPETLYISQSNDLMMKMRRLRSACVLNEKLENNGDHDKDTCCSCRDYERMGGDNMILLLNAMTVDFETISEEYYGFARPGEGTIRIQIPLTSEHVDIGVMTTYVDELKAGAYKKGNIVTHTEYDEDGFITDFNAYAFNADEEIKSQMCDNSVDFNDAKESLKKLNQNPLSDVSVNTYGRSRLETLRSGRKYLNSTGNEITPDKEEDWLWYYKVGVPRNVREVVKDEENKFVSFVCDYIHSIERTGDPFDSLVFTYYTGAKCTTETSDGGKEYKFETETDGVLNKGVKKFEEKYSLKGDSAVADLPDNLFNILISTASGIDVLYEKNGNYKTPDEYNALPTSDKSGYTLLIQNGGDDTRFPFSTSDKMRSAEITTENGVISVGFRSSEYELNIKHPEGEVLNLPVFKDDALPSFPFRPHVLSDVYIQRGDAAAFERHIRLSEIRTLDDMVEYANGSYYTVESLT